MLLPSDVARLVLGYLQEEGLSATSQAFIHESPNLKEYADHTTADGTIPACLFSAFGKGLTTILNEYVATKTKESFPAVPAAMTSLWKKLDFTLNQIKSLQNTPAISACQRTRSRVANMTRQRVLAVASPAAIICSSVSETSSIISPALTSHSMLGHSTPVSYAALPSRPAPGSSTQPQIQDVRLSALRDSPAQILVSEHRQTTGPMSPGRRKWDTPRKRGGAVSGSSSLARCATPATGVSAEPQLEEAVDENFPQLVIQNARDKILGDRSLQEKLAENINKILGSDPVPQISKASSSTVEADQSIDEILGLQGEIHMSDDAIHDILEQTESDPAFQALYDLFDYNKSRFPDGEPGDEDIGGNAEQSDMAGPSPVVKPLLTEQPGTAPRDADASDTTMTTPQKVRAGPERKARKAGTLLKKKAPGRSGKASRIEGSSARLLVSAEEPRRASSDEADPNRKEKSSLLSDGIFGTAMDIDEPLNTPPPPSDGEATLEPASKCGSSTTSALSEATPGPSPGASAAFAVPEAALACNEERRQEPKQAQGPNGRVVESAPPAYLSPVPVELSSSPALAVNLPHTSPVTPQPSCSTTSAAPAPTPASTSATLTASSPSSAQPAAASSSPAPADNQAAPSKAAADPSIVSLKIIISENQEEESPSDPALTQAISSITKDKIPTIYISSPAKSPAGSSTPIANMDEAAQAVSGLQNSEVPASPLCSKAGALVASPLTGTSQVQQNYIFQLPLDAAAPAVQGATASYFLLTEPPTPEPQTRPMLLPKAQPLPASQFGLPTPGQPQGYAAGSTLILPSPLKPMVLPVSVMGQNTLGKVQMVSNQLVAIPNAVPLQPPETLKPISSKVAIQWPAAAGPEPHPAGKLAQPVPGENAGQQDPANALRHKRILCFDSSAATGTNSPPATSPSPSVQKPEKDNARAATQTKPAILGGNKPKRRVQTVKCTADSPPNKGFVKEPEKPPPPPPAPQQKEPARRNSRKQDHSILNKELPPSGSSGATEAAKPETLKKAESKRRSRSDTRKSSHDKDGDGEKAKGSRSSNSPSSDAATKSGTKKDKEDGSRKDVTEKTQVKSCDGRAEKKAPPQETPNVTANKENEMKGSLQEQQQQAAPLSSPSRDFSPAAATQSASNAQPKAPKTPSKASSLAKQAAVMLHDIQSLNAPSTPVKRPGAAGPDAPPRSTGADRVQEDTRPPSADSPRTPARQKKGKDGEGTPKHLIPPNTPDVPTCSPASEAGSENSINMAAHTLMILSRAAIARTGTPLKDSLRQEGADKKLPAGSKNSKKRKQASPTGSPPAKKDRERKKLIDCFPHDLDVDKFLSSLHYDE